MLTTRTPLRISIGGGGTDLPSYADHHGGFVISAAIDKYVYVELDRRVREDYLVACGLEQRSRTVAGITDDFVREALTLHDPGPSKLVSRADLPSGTGLGSSGSFTVGLLNALHAAKGQQLEPGTLAEEACRIEIDRLGRPVGRQDPYIASYGGLQCFEFERGRVTVTPLAISPQTRRTLDDTLLLFFTGATRDAAVVLEDQRTRSTANDPAMLENLHAVKASGRTIKQVLEQGDTRRFGALMHEHWLNKRRRSPGMSNDAINRWYEVGMANGALGGKLVGAGGGGFLLFYSEDQAKLRLAMAREGLGEVRFSFEAQGSTVVTRG